MIRHYWRWFSPKWEIFATTEYVSVLTDSGRRYNHHAVFEYENDWGRRRFRLINTTDRYFNSYEKHSDYVRDKVAWECRGHYPEHAILVKSPKPEFKVYKVPQD